VTSRGAGGQLLAGLALVGASAVGAAVARPPAWELRTFNRMNRWPDGMYRPVWVAMQAGALAAAPVAAGVALASGQRRGAVRLLSSGGVAWGVAKGVKRLSGRGRPVGFVPDLHVRGDAAAGSGFPSGHAAVAAALAATAREVLPAPLRPAAFVLVGVVASARVYVGAHLPLDVVGGVGLGLTVDAARRVVVARHARRRGVAS
jgi:undecaprenyl-diphosphatase